VEEGEVVLEPARDEGLAPLGQPDDEQHLVRVRGRVRVGVGVRVRVREMMNSTCRTPSVPELAEMGGGTWFGLALGLVLGLGLGLGLRLGLG
jgi:hypothetical protein